MKPFPCVQCNSSYDTIPQLKRHHADRHGPKFSCTEKDCSFTCPESRRYMLKKHLKEAHNKVIPAPVTTSEMYPMTPLRSPEEPVSVWEPTLEQKREFDLLYEACERTLGEQEEPSRKVIVMSGVELPRDITSQYLYQPVTPIQSPEHQVPVAPLETSTVITYKTAATPSSATELVKEPSSTTEPATVPSAATELPATAPPEQINPEPTIPTITPDSISQPTAVSSSSTATVSPTPGSSKDKTTVSENTAQENQTSHDETPPPSTSSSTNFSAVFVLPDGRKYTCTSSIRPDPANPKTPEKQDAASQCDIINYEQYLKFQKFLEMVESFKN